MVDEVTKIELPLFFFSMLKYFWLQPFNPNLLCIAPFFVCKRIEGEGDQEQYENKGSLAGGGGSCIASCIVWRHNIRGGWPARHTQHRVKNHWFLPLISADKTRNCIKKRLFENILYFEHFVFPNDPNWPLQLKMQNNSIVQCCRTNWGMTIWIFGFLLFEITSYAFPTLFGCGSASGVVRR